MSTIIDGGYYIKARCVQRSWIAHAPPIVREIWDYLVREANHKEQKYYGFVVKRGQLFRSYKEIREGLHWMVGYRKMTYHESSTKRAMKALMNEGMIELMKKPRGNLITILNYDYYQNPKNYERTDEETNSEPTANQQRTSSGLSINKNVKNVKNGRRRTRKFTPPSLNDVVQYFIKNGYSEQSAKKAYYYYNSGEPPWHDSKGTPVKNWKQKMIGVWFKPENKAQDEQCQYKEIKDSERGLPNAR